MKQGRQTPTIGVRRHNNPGKYSKCTLNWNKTEIQTATRWAGDGKKFKKTACKGAGQRNRGRDRRERNKR